MSQFQFNIDNHAKLSVSTIKIKSRNFKSPSTFLHADLAAGIKNKYEETADLLADGLICLCRSYRDINIELRLFHTQSETGTGRDGLLTINPLVYLTYVAFPKRGWWFFAGEYQTV